MRYTENLKLPIFDNPSVDKFNVGEWNNGNENVEKAIGDVGTQLDNIEQQTNIKNEKTGLIEIREKLNNAFKTGEGLQYIIVGDSTRESFNQIIYKTIREKFMSYNIQTLLSAKSGLKAEHWSKTTINLQPNYPTTDNVISLINGDGSNTIVDICLGINDIDTRTVQQVIGYLEKGINNIKSEKPNVKFVLTSPNTRFVEKANIDTKQVYNYMINTYNYAYVNVLENVFKNWELANQNGYFADTTHPNELGQAKMVNYIFNQLTDSEVLLSANKQYPRFKDKITLKGTNGICNLYGILKVLRGTQGNLTLKRLSSNKWYVFNANETDSCSSGFDSQGLNFVEKGYSTNVDVEGWFYVDNVEILNEFWEIDISTFVDDSIILSPSPNFEELNKFRSLQGVLDETHFNYDKFKNVGIKIEVVGNLSNVYIKVIGNQLRLTDNGDSHEYIGNAIYTAQQGYGYIEDKVKNIRAWVYVSNVDQLKLIETNYYCKFKNANVADFARVKSVNDVLLGL